MRFWGVGMEEAEANREEYYCHVCERRVLYSSLRKTELGDLECGACGQGFIETLEGGRGAAEDAGAGGARGGIGHVPPPGLHFGRDADNGVLMMLVEEDDDVLGARDQHLAQDGAEAGARGASGALPEERAQNQDSNQAQQQQQQQQQQQSSTAPPRRRQVRQDFRVLGNGNSNEIMMRHMLSLFGGGMEETPPPFMMSRDVGPVNALGGEDFGSSVTSFRTPSARAQSGGFRRGHVNGPDRLTFPVAAFFGPGGLQALTGFQLHGNPGDYVFGDERGLEAVINQLMENDPNQAGPPPAAKDAVASLPRFSMKPADLEKCSECVVCREAFQVGSEALKLPCGHLFDPDCILPWLSRHNNCPQCRFELRTDDMDYERRKAAAQIQQQTRTPASPPLQATASSAPEQEDIDHVE
ncbi:E3 ubiquitin-protein ligase RING1 [Porphyridium purpureum]|uniref:RING-type E3 ubiquitin transferase n=1 Tax=Porphyridium purpureum TaxID=35688 RepID=A0A5J4YJZ6_PORPP|nr:E3 ubiquitin-protein ligase RING1 [Porphyridium purpureum]|eukprot:POR2848..scf244_11